MHSKQGNPVGQILSIYSSVNRRKFFGSGEAHRHERNATMQLKQAQGIVVWSSHIRATSICRILV